MSAKLSIHEIQSFWTEQARQHGESHQASWSDLPVINLEIRQILNYLHDGDRVLDVGCANGFSTVQFATARKADFRGVDFIPEMIVAAQARLSHLAVELAGRIEFCVGNVLALDEASASYDKVVVIRVLINLGDWEHQVLALRECASSRVAAAQLVPG